MYSGFISKYKLHSVTQWTVTTLFVVDQDREFSSLIKQGAGIYLKEL